MIWNEYLNPQQHVSHFDTLVSIASLFQHSLLSFIFSSHSSSSFSPSSTPRASLPPPPHWGTLRPNLYAGVRGAYGSSPVFGWAWSCAQHDINGQVLAGATTHMDACSTQAQLEQMRHDAEERDGITKYGWKLHNGNDFGVQGIEDTKMGVNFT